MEFWEIYDQYYARVKAYLVAVTREPMAAEDLVQEVFLRADRGLPTLKDQRKLKSWLFAIAANLARDHFRRARAFDGPLQALDGLLEPAQPARAQQELEAGEMSACVQDKMLLLPPHYREVLALADEMEFSLAEVAEVTGISLANAKVRLHRARKRFREVLETHCLFEKDPRGVLICQPKSRRDRQVGQMGRKGA